MKITLSFVASADGRVTGPGGEQSREWASSEDQSLFGSLVEEIGVVTMGRNTYEEHKHFFAKSPRVRRIVMTSKTLEVPAGARVEFSSLKPLELVGQLKKEGVMRALPAAGPLLSAAFFRAKLVSELLLTIEPKLFGGGLPVLDGDVGNPELSLYSIEKVNAAGTLLLKYTVTY